MIIINSYYSNNIVFYLATSKYLMNHNIILGFNESFIKNDNMVSDVSNFVDKQVISNHKFWIKSSYTLYPKYNSPFIKPMKLNLNKKALGLLNTSISPKIYTNLSDFNETEEKLWFIKNSRCEFTQDIQCMLTSQIHSLKLKENYIIQEGVTDIDLTPDLKKYTIRSYILLFNKKMYLYTDMIKIIHHSIYSELNPDLKIHVDHQVRNGYNPRVPLKGDQRIIGYITSTLIELKKYINLDKTDEFTYMLLGCDYIITSNKAVLIEVNDNPSINFVLLNHIKSGEYVYGAYNTISEVTLPLIENTIKCITNQEFSNYVEIP